MLNSSTNLSIFARFTIMIAHQWSTRITITGVNALVEVSSTHHSLADCTLAINVSCSTHRLIQQWHPAVSQIFGVSCNNRELRIIGNPKPHTKIKILTCASPTPAEVNRRWFNRSKYINEIDFAWTYFKVVYVYFISKHLFRFLYFKIIFMLL